MAYLQALSNCLLEQIPVSVLIVDRELRVTFVNTAFCLKKRKKHAEIIHKHIGDAFPTLFLGAEQLASRIRKVIEAGVIEEDEIEWRGRVYNCKIFPLKTHLRRAQEAILLLDDITQEKELARKIRKVEQHLTNVVDSAEDLVFSTDSRGRILTWNKAAESILGYELEKVWGKTFSSLCFKEDRRKIGKQFAKLGEKKLTHYEMVLPAHSGEKVLISWSFGVIRNDQGNAVGLMGVGRDLTQRRRLEGQLVQSAKMASLGTMATGMAHELRNPLAVASGAAQLLLKREKEDFVRECSSRIHSGITRASDIIGNLLRFSQVSGTGQEPVAVNSTLDETLSLVEHQILLEKIKIAKDYAPSPPQVLVNRNRLQQVLMNLIINAVDAMGEKGGELRLGTKKNGNNSLEVSVGDSGCGIAKEDVSKIFDPFFTTKAEGKNTGLGLFIAYGIIKDWGGDIVVESRRREGTTFIITIPTVESLEAATVAA